MTNNKQFIVVIVDLNNKLSDTVFASFDTFTEAYDCTLELDQFYDLYFDMYSNFTFVVRDNPNYSK